LNDLLGLTFVVVVDVKIVDVVVVGAK